MKDAANIRMKEGGLDSDTSVTPQSHRNKGSILNFLFVSVSERVMRCGCVRGLQYYKVVLDMVSVIMSVKSKLVDVLQKNYPDGIQFSPISRMMLEAQAGVHISDEVIDEVKESMFTNRDGVSFVRCSIADGEVIQHISADITSFVDRFNKYEPEAIYERYRTQINTSIIRNPEDFQDFISTILPSDYSNKTLVRLRSGPGVDSIVAAVEKLVVEGHDGKVSLDQLKEELFGFTESRIRKIITDKSKKLVLVDDDTFGTIVMSIELSRLPNDFYDVVKGIQKKLALYNIELAP